ncbi:hypothetical protein CRUP_012239, partial [Coryphaenoides rupestris]
ITRQGSEDTHLLPDLLQKTYSSSSSPGGPDPRTQRQQQQQQQQQQQAGGDLAYSQCPTAVRSPQHPDSDVHLLEAAAADEGVDLALPTAVQQPQAALRAHQQ